MVVSGGRPSLVFSPGPGLCPWTFWTWDLTWTWAWDLSLTISFIEVTIVFKKSYLELECSSDDDCKDGKCDLTDNTCRKECTEQGDCSGFNSTCDINKGLCVNSKLSSKLELWQDYLMFYLSIVAL